MVCILLLQYIPFNRLFFLLIQTLEPGMIHWIHAKQVVGIEIAYSSITNPVMKASGMHPSFFCDIHDLIVLVV